MLVVQCLLLDLEIQVQESATQGYVWLLKFQYDGNSAPTEYNIAGNSSFWSIGVSGSNTLTINGNSGNWQFGWYVGRLKESHK